MARRKKTEETIVTVETETKMEEAENAEASENTTEAVNDADSISLTEENNRPTEPVDSEVTVNEPKPAEEAVTETIANAVQNQDMQTIIEILNEIKQDNIKEVKYAKRQSRFAIITSVAAMAVCFLLAAALLYIVPQVTLLIDQANYIMAETNELMGEADVVMKNMETVTDELAHADLTGMLDNVNTLVISSEAQLEEAMSKIDSMDIESLNKAIRDLGTIVNPLARLFGGKR